MQRISTLLATLALGMATTACSSNLEETASTASSPRTPAATDAAAVTETASTTGSTVPASTSSTSSTTTVTASSEPLTSGVPILVADLGDAWVNVPIDPLTEPSLGDLPCQDVQLDRDLIRRLEPVDAATYLLDSGDVHLAVQQYVVRGEAEQLASDLVDLFDAAQACLGVERVNEDGERVLYESFDLPDVGDQRLGGIMTILEPGGVLTMRGHTAIVRVGSMVLMLVQRELLATAATVPMVDDAAFLKLLQMAVGRMEGDEPMPTTTMGGADADELAALLLDASDLGEGWTAETAAPQDMNSLGAAPCDDVAVNPVVANRLVPTAGVIITGAGDALFQAVQELALRGKAMQLGSDLDAVSTASLSCDGATGTSPDGERYTFATFELPDIGDQRFAVRATIAEPPDFQVTWHVFIATVRVGDAAIQLDEIEILSTPDAVPTFGEADFVALLQTAVDRVEAG